MSLNVINDVRKLTTALYGQHKIYCGCSVNYIHDRPVVRSSCTGCTFARCGTYGRVYIYKKHIYIYIYIYDEDFSPLYDKCGARSGSPNNKYFNAVNGHIRVSTLVIMNLLI